MIDLDEEGEGGGLYAAELVKLSRNFDEPKRGE